MNIKGKYLKCLIVASPYKTTSLDFLVTTINRYTLFRFRGNLYLFSIVWRVVS